jgi:FG-GAP-like repeat
MGSAAAAAPAKAKAKQPVSSGNFGGATYIKNVVNPNVAVPTAVAVGDVLGGGRNNLVVTTLIRENSAAGGTMVAVYPQLKNGKLGAPLSIKVPDESTHVTVADLYDNGQNEILLPADYYTDVISFSRGRLTWSRIPVPANTLTVANFNDNKYADLLITTDQAGVTEIWTGSASHKFSLWRTVTFPSLLPYGYSGTSGPEVYGADFDHAGRPSVAILTSNGFAVRLQTRPGVFGPEQDYAVAPVDGVTFPPSSMVVGDVTGDGYPDVVLDTMANQPWSGVEVFASAHNGTFKSPVVYPTADIPTGMALFDLTGNGRDDVIVEHTSWSSIGVLLQQTNGALASEELHGASVFDYDPPAVGDLNGDGRPDIAFTAESRGIGIMYAGK